MNSDRILKTKHLIFEKSDFLIDLKQTSTGSRYFEITQTIHNGNGHRACLKINPKVLHSLVASLLELNGQPEKAATIPADQSRQDFEKLKNAYLKGVSLESLQLQFPGYTIAEMEAMLRNEGISVVNQPYKPKIQSRFKPGRR